MEEFLEFVLRQLVDYPDEVVITKHETPKKALFQLQLRQSDVGKVIGKHGHTIAAIRDLMNAAGSRHGQRVSIDILEDEAA